MYKTYSTKRVSIRKFEDADDCDNDENSRLLEKQEDKNVPLTDTSTSYVPNDMAEEVPATSKKKQVGMQVSKGSSTDTNQTISITISPPTPKTSRRRSEEFSPPDFDYMFKNPTTWFKFGNTGDSLDEGIYSFDDGTSRLSPPEVPNSIKTVKSSASLALPQNAEPHLTRVDSVMEQSFSEMLNKSIHNSQGFGGFRKRTAKHISHKYCSYCRCDDMVFVFLYVVFGMAYLCAGVLGLEKCSNEALVNYFLICDGVLSVFIFPVTVMEWPTRIGGCVNEHEKLGGSVYFVVILVFRLVAAVCGTVILGKRVDVFRQGDAICTTVLSLLEVGVFLEWASLFVAVLLPFCAYGLLYAYAKRQHKTTVVF